MKQHHIANNGKLFPLDCNTNLKGPTTVRAKKKLKCRKKKGEKSQANIKKALVKKKERNTNVLMF